MRLRIVFLIFAFAFTNLAWAQIDRESYNSAVDYLNCKSVELSLKGSQQNLRKFQNECPCDRASYEEIKAFLTYVGKLDATVALSDEIESMKELFRETLLIEDVVLYLSDSIFSNNLKYQKSLNFAEKRKGTQEFDDFKMDLKIVLPNILGEYDDVTQAEISPTQLFLAQNVMEQDNNQEKESESWFRGIKSQVVAVSMVFSILFSLLTILYISNFLKSSSVEVPNNVKIYVKRKIDEFSYNQNSFKSQYNPLELRDANNRIRDLELQIRNLDDKLSLSLVASDKAQQQNSDLSQEREVEMEVFFLSTPNSDGSFNDSSASPSYKEGASIYKFTKLTSSKAKFQIDEKDTSIKLALQYPDKNIDPVCDAENAFNFGATRIVTVEAGEAELQGDKWVRNIKAKIRYES